MSHLTTYGVLGTAFNSAKKVIESSLSIVYAQSDEEAHFQGLHEMKAELFPEWEGWSNHHVTLAPIQGLTAAGSSEKFIHLYAIRIFQMCIDGVKNMKVSLHYQINDDPMGSQENAIRRQLVQTFSPLDGWEIVIDHMVKKAVYSSMGPHSLN